MTDVLSEASPRADLYQRVTDEIVQAIEMGAGKFIMPWHGVDGRPRNAFTGDTYHGINILVLWAAARNRGYASWHWATFRQWQDLGVRIRKGEKATAVVFYKQVPIEAEDAKTGEKVEDTRLIARMYFLFNAAQVDGWAEPNHWPGVLIGRDENVDNFIAATGADIRCGDIAAYMRSTDYISIPHEDRFVGTETSSATDSYYSTVFHELVHWTGHHVRLARNLSSRFGTHDYAMEELVAELGAAYLCAEYLVHNEPRHDHAAYIGEWLKVLKGDKRAIFLAAAKANEAVQFLMTC